MRTLVAVVLFASSAGVLHPQVLQQNVRPAVQQNMAPAGINSFVVEGFEGERFPPPGWTLEYTGIQYWSRFVGASGYGAGTASAVFPFYDAPTNTTQSLVLSMMGPSAPDDSLRFDHAYATYQTENDRLIIETSTDGGTTYAILVTLNGGVSGALVTAPPTTDVFVPTASQWKTKRYALPAGANRIRFKAISAYGNYLYLDNCTIGTRKAIDIASQSIDIPNPTVTLPQIPKATVKNLGTASQTFTITMLIAPGGYSSTRTVTALPGDATSQVSFDGWVPTVGTYGVTVFTDLTGDLDHTNDTARGTILANRAQQVKNITSMFRDGQVFVTWDNLTASNVQYTLYRSSIPLQYGHQLASAQNLGNVRGNSSLNQRLTNLIGTTYLRIDSASSPLPSNKGLFVATTSAPGSFYYALTANAIGFEDTTIVVGSNSLATPVSENVMMPKPVWQTSTTTGGRTFEIYAQFATRVTSSVYPQMTNAGSYPFHFAIVKSGTVSPHPLTFWMHGSSGSFLPTTQFRSIGDPNEWVVTIDDQIPNNDAVTWYYGYHENYDIQSDINPIPTSGTLHDYTAARVAHTVEWVIRNLPVDSTRTYLTGWSMGAIGAIFTAMTIPSRFAAIFVYAPELDLAKRDDPYAARQWGSPLSNLPTNNGIGRNERLNATVLAGINRLNSLPVMYTFCGKNDVSVGWSEKIPFYDSVNASGHGGFHFWGMTDHVQTFFSSPWQPSFPNFSFFARYRTNLSYPAFSNCTINNDPGNGTPTAGDPIGSINGHLDWNDGITDTTDRWEITLRLKDLATTLGPDPAPDSAMTDVTLRRLQGFHVPGVSIVNWENTRNSVVVQKGSFAHDGGLVTIPGVRMYKDSSRLAVTYMITFVAGHDAMPGSFMLLQNYPNPFNPSTTIRYGLPQRSQVTLTVFNTLGQQVAVLQNGEQEAGHHEAKFEAKGLSSGVYFYRLSAGEFMQTKKLLLVH